MKKEKQQELSRRALLRRSAALGSLALPSLGIANDAGGNVQGEHSHQQPSISGNAEHVISIWLGGGMGQIDTFDPKEKGDPKANRPGAYYDSIETSLDGVRLCEHLPNVARLMEHVTAVRSVNHDMIDEHAAATNRMHTGRAVSGTITYPSIGSIIAHERGAASDTAPPYVLIGYPNVTRGPGFLGAKHGYLYLTDTTKGPAGLSRPEGITMTRQQRREHFLATLRQQAKNARGPLINDYEQVIDQSLKLSGPEFNRVFELDREPNSLRDQYGGEFGQRCLLSRRLVEQGVRFIEVSHNLNFLNGSGWDVHNGGILQQHKLIQEMDIAVATLIEDLQSKRLLDKTLIMITTEFGRPPEFDGGGGRGHQGTAFTCVLAGGGLNHCGAFGETDERSQKILQDPVSVPDFFATVCASVGVDYQKNLYAGDRPVPITDRGRPIKSLLIS
ncbi:DUF1501 domain-containing protein [Rhodopirellula sp. MGV]|uniref:DUF1501 domain-containing protein n=1 Tax=Rhodopirellula sp. MGV TaxID=2023130 RepID=UPI000B9636F5|nr:DUF1501 domain-containing protein [Rhodopirellula sp. MGV]OYP28307.1 hypothetical protein CGZ80_26165 [Rhodopirellula sp. MGV]PNY38815.1 DUF1501 domain-containing protein [Rhodopirellula baltica]